MYAQDPPELLVPFYLYCIVYFSCYTTSMALSKIFRAKPPTFTKYIPTSKRTDGAIKRDGKYVLPVDETWTQLSAHQKIREMGKSGAKLAAIALSLRLLSASVGIPGEAASDQVRDDLAIKAAGQEYLSRTILGRFQLAFIDPIRIDQTVYPKDGSGALGWLNRNSHDYLIGQSCLAGTAYNTDPSQISGLSKGTISAVASLSVLGSTVSVHPAGSNAPALTFKQRGGELMPDDSTRQTLAANGCAPDGISFWRIDTLDKSNNKALPPLHPGA